MIFQPAQLLLFGDARGRGRVGPGVRPHGSLVPRPSDGRATATWTARIAPREGITH